MTDIAIPDGGEVRVTFDASDCGKVAHLTIDHPERRNAIGPATSLRARCDWADDVTRDAISDHYCC